MESSRTDALSARLNSELAEPHPNAGGDRPSQLTSRQEKLLRLGEFQEASGRLLAIDEGGEKVSIVLSIGTLQFSSQSREAEICLEAFREEIGNRVSILRTPSKTNPLRVRAVGSVE